MQNCGIISTAEYGALTFVAFIITLRSGCARRASLQESLRISVLTTTALGLTVYGFIYVEMCAFLLSILGVVLVGGYPCRIKGDSVEQQRSAPSAPSAASLVSVGFFLLQSPPLVEWGFRADPCLCLF
ncbi:predicted protein [Coccidioides posadasii str. Silveira]|uniref:Predicted protein n=1 Tax=Coccidioides posadasii (strain RMSCC 757 / Silveira) TaxID=443226 RepID=E9D515_COCPS|nr:predicted protein [Coccidioides posadasii str. Silveira]